MSVKKFAQGFPVVLSLAVASVVVLSGCKSKEQAAPEPAPAATTAATDEWAWADAPASTTAPAPTPAPVADTASRDVTQQRPISSPPPAASKPAAPKPAATTSRAPKEPQSRFEDPPDDDAPAAPAPAPAPRTVSYTAATGGSIEVKLDQALDSATAVAGQTVSATLAMDLTDGAGNVVLPRGTRMTGTVTEAVSAKKVQKKSALAFQFTQAELPDGTRVAMAAGKRVEGKGYTKKDGAIIGGSAAGGALLGQILGGDTEATAAGAVVGGAIGTGVAMSRKGEDVQIAAGTSLELTLERPVTVERPVPGTATAR